MIATAKMIEELKTVFAELDARYVEDMVVWAKGRVEAVREAKKTSGFKSSDYEALFNIAGGKTWYNMFNGRAWDDIEFLVRKNAQAVIEKRWATIGTKLEKAGVTEVLSKTFELTKDGFDGSYGVMTEKGAKVITINTIVAGGYNIQALHNRTLVKVK